MKKKKSFYFEDYTDYENKPEKKNTKSIKIPSGRIVFLFFIFFSLIFVSSTKIIYLSLSPEKKIFTQKSRRKNHKVHYERDSTSNWVPCQIWTMAL